MSYKTWANQYLGSAGVIASSSDFNASMDGLEDRLEDQVEVGHANGVESGFACSISTTNIAIASGVAWVEGKQFTGSDTVAFSGAGADTYYVYIDPTDESSPYKKTTSAVTAAQLELCKVVWDGSALSSLEDTRIWGITPWTISAGNAQTVTTGIKALVVVPHDFYVLDVIVSIGDTGDSGSTSFDVHGAASGSTPVTIFDATWTAPTIPSTHSDYTQYSFSPAPSLRKLAKGSMLWIEVDTAATTAMNAAITVRGRFYDLST